MRTPVSAVRQKYASCLAILLLFLATPQIRAAGLPGGAEQQYQPAPDEFSGLGTAVMELLRSGDAARFATNLTATPGDWKSIISTNLPAKSEEELKGFQTVSDYERQKVESGAKVVLEKAAALHLDFAGKEWQVRVIMPKNFGTFRNPNLQAENESLPWTEKVEIILEPAAGGSTNGDYKLVLRNLMKFPGGWRCSEGIQWETFPNGVGDEKTRRELAIAGKVAAFQGFNDQDDPALRKLGETLVRFIRERDPAIKCKSETVAPKEGGATVGAIAALPRIRSCVTQTA